MKPGGEATPFSQEALLRNLALRFGFVHFNNSTQTNLLYFKVLSVGCGVRMFHNGMGGGFRIQRNKIGNEERG